MRRAVYVLTVLLVLGSCLAAVACESLESTTTTAGGGGSDPTETTEGSTATSTGGAVTSVPAGYTPLPGVSGGTLLGRWHNAISGDVIEFLSDGTVLGTYADTVGGTVYYTVSGDQMSLSTNLNGNDFFLLTTTFSVDGDTLTIVDSESGEAGTFQRVN